MPALSAKDYLLIVLAGFTIFYIVRLVAGVRVERSDPAPGESTKPNAGGLLIGFVTNFFDTFGIGSFATTTAVWRQFKIVRDDRIPGTLNVGHTFPAIVQAFIYTTIVAVGSRTLILMIVAAIAGSYLGAGVVSRWPIRRIQFGMGGALLVAAALFLMKALNVGPGGGELLELDGTLLVIGVTVNFLLGALMTLGIGLYGPCMILVSLLGMNPTAAFPIMMGSCAFLMPVASSRFIKARRFDAGAALGLLLGGIPAVFIAAFIVKSMPVAWVRWLVIVVVVYTAVGLIRTAMSAPAGEPAAAPAD
jgi:uncharacterized membrane protein YfcA